MSASGWIQLALLAGITLALAYPLGLYIARVFGDGPAPFDRVLLPVERLVYRALGIDPGRQQRWTAYALSVLAFSLVSVLGLYALQRVQGSLPLNPTDVGAVPPALAFNTAISFVTNTNWQNYARRVDDEPPHPDDRPGGAELRLRGRRDRRGDRPRARAHAHAP